MIRKTNKSPSVVHRTLLPSGLTPEGNLPRGPKINTQEIKHCNISLHYFTPQQDHQVAYSIKRKKNTSKLINTIVTTCRCYILN